MNSNQLWDVNFDLKTFMKQLHYSLSDLMYFACLAGVASVSTLCLSAMLSSIFIEISNQAIELSLAKDLVGKSFWFHTDIGSKRFLAGYFI